MTYINLYPDQDVDQENESNRLKYKFYREGAASRINIVNILANIHISQFNIGMSCC
jgi:hypothetical protein